jgi:hypothetical protein
VAKSSEALGKQTAKAMFGEAAKGERTLTAMGRRAVEEAVPNAALAGGAALGHGMMDALIEDKPFAAEHIVNEAGLGALVGGAFGAGATLFGRAASKVRARDMIRKQGGLLDATSAESLSAHQSVREAVSGFDAALEHHQAAFGALKGMEEVGELGGMGPDFLRSRRKA